MVEKIVEVGIMFDFYGKLLTDKQYLAIELYYIHDLSLGEIGEELNISRQGVYDVLKRAEKKLYEYEDVLGLIKKFYDNHSYIEEIVKFSNEIQEIAKQKEMNTIKEKAISIRTLGLKILKSREGVE